MTEREKREYLEKIMKEVKNEQDYLKRQKEIINRNNKEIDKKEMEKLTRKEYNDRKKEDYSKLLREYEDEVRKYSETGKQSERFTELLIQLATMAANSVTKKCIDVSFNEMLVKLKNSINKDTNYLKKLDNLSKTKIYELNFNENGDLIRNVIDKSAKNAESQLITENFGDGLDLVSIAIVNLLDITEKTIKNNNIDDNFLEKSEEVRQLRKRVVIKDTECDSCFETVNIKPIQTVYRAVRKEIFDNRNITNNSKYMYIADIITDADSDISDTIYRRCGKYADIGGYVRDYNDSDTVCVADDTVYYDMQKTIADLNLTIRQLQVLKLRLQGHGIKAISTYLNVSTVAIKHTLQQIQQKYNKLKSK